MADDRHKIVMAPDLGAQDTKSVIGIVERHPLDKAGQDFSSRRFRLSLDCGCHDVLIAVAVNNFLLTSNCRARFALAAGLSEADSSPSIVARVVSWRSRSMHARCVRISCGVNMRFTPKTNRGSARGAPQVPTSEYNWSL